MMRHGESPIGILKINVYRGLMLDLNRYGSKKQRKRCAFIKRARDDLDIAYTSRIKAVPIRHTVGTRIR